MCFGIFPKNFWPCSHVSNVFDVFCVFGVLFCVSCVFLSSLFFLFSKKFAPRIWRVWCVSDSSTCLSCILFHVFSFFAVCHPRNFPTGARTLWYLFTDCTAILSLFETITCHWLNFTVYSESSLLLDKRVPKMRRCRALKPICHVGCKIFLQTKYILY